MADGKALEEAALHVQVGRDDGGCGSGVADAEEAEEVYLKVAKEGGWSAACAACYGGLVVFLDEGEDERESSEREEGNGQGRHGEEWVCFGHLCKCVCQCRY